MAGYIERVVDRELDELLEELSAVSLEGPRAVGKTETALRRARTVFRLDNDRALAIARAEPQRLAQGERPILIDEWQRLPSSWDVVRRAVDADFTGSRFLLTGSASPNELPTHSGAGRIVAVRMRPLSLAERLGGTTVRLSELLRGSRPPVEGASKVDLAGYASEIVRSGLPAAQGLSDRMLRGMLDGYLNRIIEYDIVEQGTRVRDPRTLRTWLSAYAAASSTTTSFTKIAQAASSRDGQTPARSTALAYRGALERAWMIEATPAWLPTPNRLRRAASAPVHQLADPAFAARLLGVDVDALLGGSPGRELLPRDGPLLGGLFESLVTLSVRVYAQANEARVSHLRTRAGEHEVDLIVERTDGRVVALEVKLGGTVDDDDVRHLRWLGQRIGAQLLDAAVVTTGHEAYRRRDGIAVIPAALLGA
ncbi:MAG: DUF4143 domain-containing protein [Acidimicrobiaceae bacterium]|nr:DUF4143 domain-containing protein [Acidimicrobiaceae bacterium]